MTHAIEQAKKAQKRGEVPIGAVIICNGKIVGTGYNKRERSNNALAHAEMVAINRACRKLKSWRLDGCEMYVTLEPCPMCAGAIVNARIKRVIVGARQRDTVDGANAVTADIYTKNNLNHRTEVVYDLHPECSEMLKAFFVDLRSNNS